MRTDDELRRLRQDLYRADADAATVRRYEAARDALRGDDRTADVPPVAGRRARSRVLVPLAALILAAAVAAGWALTARTAVRDPIALDRGALAGPVELRWSAWPGASDGQRAELTKSLRDPARLARLLRRYPDLVPMHDAPSTVVASDPGRALTLDAFGPRVTPTSEVVVIVRCGRATGAFRIRLTTLVQKDAAVMLAPLAVRGGRCSAGAQAIRYRPLLGMLPTAAELQAPAGSAMAVVLTG